MEISYLKPLCMGRPVYILYNKIKITKSLEWFLKVCAGTWNKSKFKSNAMVN